MISVVRPDMKISARAFLLSVGCPATDQFVEKVVATINTVTSLWKDENSYRCLFLSGSLSRLFEEEERLPFQYIAIIMDFFV